MACRLYRKSIGKYSKGGQSGGEADVADMGMGTGINTGLASPDTCRAGAAAPQQRASRVLIIIPCFNEEASVGGLLSEIAATGRGYHTLVVDDGSSDATSAVASCRSPVARLA